MFSLETLDINLLSITEDSFEASYTLSNEYFESLDDAEINSGDVNAVVSIRKASTDEFALTLSIEGSVTVQCDRCLDDMSQSVKGESSFIVKLTHDTDVDADDVIAVDPDEGILSTAWLLYEVIALAIPIKHVHAPGKCNCAMIEKLEELSATRSGDGVAEDAIDPRWAGLAKLKDDQPS